MYEKKCLVVRVRSCHFGIFVHDIGNVYKEYPRVHRMPNQDCMYEGVVMLEDTSVPIVDFAKRIQLACKELPTDSPSTRSLITFRTNVNEKMGILVDEIIGFENVSDDRMHQSKVPGMKKCNIKHLLPLIVEREFCSSLMYVMDVSYITKTIVEENPSEIEFF